MTRNRIAETNFSDQNMAALDPTKQREVPALAALLGSNVKDWPYSEEALIYALQLRSQQEQTKRQYYKLENINRSLELLKVAMAAGVPGPLIPHLFNNPLPERDRETESTEENISSLIDKQPKSYKFPPTELPTKKWAEVEVKAHKRTQSPARIGAEAVAVLNNNMSLKEEDASSETSTHISPPSSHRRIFSMPVVKNEPATGVLNFSNWQTFHGNSQLTNGVRKPLQYTKKHRRTKSTNSAFGVIDLNSVNQVSFKQSHSRSSSACENNKPVKLAKFSTADTDDTFSEPSSNDTTVVHFKKTSTPPRTLLKGPNYVDNLLNS